MQTSIVLLDLPGSKAGPDMNACKKNQNAVEAMPYVFEHSGLFGPVEAI